VQLFPTRNKAGGLEAEAVPAGIRAFPIGFGFPEEMRTTLALWRCTIPSGQGLALPWLPPTGKSPHRADAVLRAPDRRSD